MTDRFDSWQTVIPAKGRIREAATELLAIAGDSRLVRTAGNGTEFLVPAWVANAFVTPAKTEPPKTRRSRAKKEVN